MFKVVENSCRYTVPPDVTSTFHEGQSWSILMAPYDTSSTGGWNPDEGFYYNERPNFFTAVNAFTFYDADRNGVGCGIEKQRGLSNAAIAGIAVGSAVLGLSGLCPRARLHSGATTNTTGEENSRCVSGRSISMAGCDRN